MGTWYKTGKKKNPPKQTPDSDNNAESGLCQSDAFLKQATGLIGNPCCRAEDEELLQFTGKLLLLCREAD